MPTLNATITTIGRAALSTNTFAPVNIAVGSGVLAADASTNALTNQVKTRPANIQARQDGDDVSLHVVALDDTSDVYDVREFALVDAGGDFLAVYGGSDVVVAKAAGSVLHLALDLVLVDADVGSIVIGDTNYLMPDATEELPGKVELATNAEAQAGVDTERAVTPRGVAAYAGAGLDKICAANWLYQEGLSSTTTNDVRAIVRGLGLWVAVGEGGLIETSPDGINWSAASPDGSYTGHFRAIFFNPDAPLFVAVGSGSEIQTSPDGVNWTSRQTGGTDVLYGVTWDGPDASALYTVVGETSGGAGYIKTSPDGITWTARTIPAGNDPQGYRAVCAANGVVVAVGMESASAGGSEDHPVIHYSSDHGVSWTAVVWGVDRPFAVGGRDAYAVAWDDERERFVVTGRYGFVGVSDDGITWASARDADFSEYPSDPAFAVLPVGEITVVMGGQLITTTGNGDSPYILIGTDGAAWSFVPALPTEKAILCAYYADGLILAGLDGGGILRSQVFGHRL
jgi:hypothetical protein